MLAIKHLGNGDRPWAVIDSDLGRVLRATTFDAAEKIARVTARGRVVHVLHNVNILAHMARIERDAAAGVIKYGAHLDWVKDWVQIDGVTWPLRGRRRRALEPYAQVLRMRGLHVKAFYRPYAPGDWRWELRCDLRQADLRTEPSTFEEMQAERRARQYQLLAVQAQALPVLIAAWHALPADAPRAAARDTFIPTWAMLETFATVAAAGALAGTAATDEAAASVYQSVTA